MPSLYFTVSDVKFLGPAKDFEESNTQYIPTYEIYE